MDYSRFHRNYTSPPHPSAFSGVSNLKKVYPHLPESKIHQHLQRLDTYSRHKETRKGKYQNPFVIRSRLSLLQLDLLDVKNLSSANDGIKYIFVILDTFSRKAWFFPLKRKTKENTVEAFHYFLHHILTKRDRKKVERALSDKGREFDNDAFRELLAEEHMTLSHPNLHAPHVERFNRTIQKILYGYMTEQKTERYIDALSLIFESYNKRIHSAHGLTPQSAFLPKNEMKVKYILAYKESKRNIPRRSPRLKVGDFVRIENPRETFKRSYKETHSVEMYIVRRIIDTLPYPMYEVEDLQGDIVDSKLYAHQMAKIEPSDEMFDIEKILQSRGKGRLKEVLVKWKGYPEAFNTWIKASQAKRIQS